MHCLVEHMYRVFFANDLENNIAFCACCFDGTAQPYEIDPDLGHAAELIRAEVVLTR